MYKFLPFRFSQRTNSVLLTNEVGNYHFISKNDFDSFVQKKLNKDSMQFFDLKSKGFLYDGFLSNVIEIQATQFRTKHQFLYNFTSLHMFVVTLRCNQRCSYCHASSQGEDSGAIYDMDKETAIRSVEIAFQSPSPTIKIEFQGGEPLLNFDIVKIIVEHAQRLNESYNKELEFVICTNLVSLSFEHLEYFKKNKIAISTSLDGPREIHNKCRYLANGKGSYDLVVQNIKLAMDVLGNDMVSALMTVTPFSIHRLKDVVDEYINHQLEYIFIRKLNPFGNAYNNKQAEYNNSAFIESYKEALDYIIQINLNGFFFPEAFTTILLSRILTPFSTGFVDLQNPAGAGIGGAVYDVNGDVYVSDEARMMYRTTGDKFFSIGNVKNDTWHNIFTSPKLKKIISNSCIDSIPGCSWCVFKPYCGADPVRNSLLQKNMIGHRPTNEFCQKHSAIFNLLFDYLDCNDKNIDDVFWSWLTNRSLSEIQNYDSLEMKDCVE